MLLETNRLIIHDVKPEDEIPYIEMASDGSLLDIGFDSTCDMWMGNWIKEAAELAAADNPSTDYLAYTILLKESETVIGSVGCSYYEDLQETGITFFLGAKYRGNGFATEAVRAYIKYFFDHYDIPRLIATIRDENISSWRVIEKAGFILIEIKPYKDINDKKEEMYRFYQIRNRNSEKTEVVFQAEKNNALDIARMAIKMWNNHNLEDLADEFMNIITSEKGVIFILSINGQPVGFAQCQLRHDYVEGTDSSPVGYLEGIFVEQEYRNKGYAGKLLKSCEKWAKNKGCTEFASDCELHNETSLAFHLKVGFSEANRIICFAKKL